jgi:hypothetical protein
MGDTGSTFVAAHMTPTEESTVRYINKSNDNEVKQQHHKNIEATLIS